MAVVFAPLMPAPLWRLLAPRGFEMVKAPEQEFAAMGPKVLALASRQCLVPDGNSITKNRLGAADCGASTYRGNEISLKAEGGSTCLVRPILRG